MPVPTASSSSALSFSSVYQTMGSASYSTFRFSSSSSASATSQILQLLSLKQVCTQRSWKRPYGVGLLVAGLDESGAHLYYNCPSGNYFEYQAFAIGSRSQVAKTYLERKFRTFNGCSREDLIKHGLFAIKETLQGEQLSNSTCTVAVLGKDEPFQIIDQKAIQQLIDSLEPKEESSDQSVMQEDKSPDVAPMDI